MATLVVNKIPGSLAGWLARGMWAAGRRAAALHAAWRNRRAVADLLDCDDRMLADIGVTRGDVRCALALPLGRDPSARLVVLSVERRAARAALRKEMRERAERGAT